MRLSCFIFILASLFVALSCSVLPSTETATPSADSKDSLIQQLSDEDPNVRWNVACALKEIGKPAVDPLIAALSESNPDVRMWAAWALGEIKDVRAVEPLIAAMKDDDQDVRIAVVLALGEIKDTRAVEPLIAALKDEEPGVQYETARALGEIKDARAVEPLITALKDESQDLRSQAFQALKLIGKPAVDSLIAVLKDENLDVRKRATWILGMIKDTRAVEPLIAAMYEDPRIGLDAAQALGEIGDIRAVQALIPDLANEDPHVRGHTALLLGALKDTRAVEPLIAALKDENLDVRWQAAQSLGWIKDDRAVEPLIAILNDEDAHVRMRTAKALGEIKDVRAIEPLTASLRDEEYSVRSSAKIALGMIRSANNIPQPVPKLISFDIKVDVSLSNAPALNQTAELTCKAFSQYGAPNAMIQINLPEGLALVDGDLAWQDNISENQTIEFTATVKAVKIGHWRIHPLVKHQDDLVKNPVEDDFCYYRKQVNDVTLTVAEDNTQIKNISGRVTEIDVDKRTGKSCSPESHASTLTPEQQAQIDKMIAEKKKLIDQSELRFHGRYVTHVAAGTIEKGIRNDEGARTNQYYVIQFYDDQASVDKSTRDTLQQIGCVLYGYVQYNAFYAKIPPEALDTVISLVNDGEVRYLGRIPVQAKIYPELLNKAELHPFTSIHVVVKLVPDMTQEDIDSLRSYMQVDSYYFAPSYVVYGTARGYRINNILKLPIVHWIEEQGKIELL